MFGIMAPAGAGQGRCKAPQNKCLLRNASGRPPNGSTNAFTTSVHNKAYNVRIGDTSHVWRVPCRASHKSLAARICHTWFLDLSDVGDIWRLRLSGTYFGAYNTGVGCARLKLASWKTRPRILVYYMSSCCKHHAQAMAFFVLVAGILVHPEAGTPSVAPIDDKRVMLCALSS